MEDHFHRVFEAAQSQHVEHAGVKRRRDDIPEAAASEDARDSDELTEAQLAELVAAAETADVPSLDVTGVKRLLLSVEKAITRNELARTKYAGEPARFMDTEVELDDQLKKLRVLAAAPDLYGVLISSATLRSLLELLSHENSDIACDVVSLLAELTDDDAIVDHKDTGEVGGRTGGDGSSTSLSTCYVARL
jgi:beta-catenin-like protein 1